MNRLFQLMLNIRPSSWTAGGQWHLEWKSVPKHDLGLLAAASAAIVAWLVIMVYRREGKSLHLLSRWSLIFLRLIVLSGILVMLLEPVVVFSRIEPNPSNLIILTDVSGSMNLQDAYTDPHQIAGITAALNIKELDLQQQTRRQLFERALAQGVQKKLEANGDRIVHRLDFATRLLPSTTQPTSAEPSSETAGTAIGVAIRQSIAEYQGQPIAGVLLISDGQNNTGESPKKAAEFAGASGVPISCLAVGTTQGPRSASITNLEVSPTVFVRDSIPVHVQVESKGMNGNPVTVVLERARNGQPFDEIGRVPLVLGENGQMQTVNFDNLDLREPHPVKLELRARLENAGPALKVDDHSKTAAVNVIEQRMNVLFIAGETFPEVEFIRNMLMGDRDHLNAYTWNQTADVDYEQPCSKGLDPLRRLPETAEELKTYDCIILYDPDPNLFPPDYSQLLSDFVSKEGGGLIFVAGERNTKNLFDRPDDPSLAWLNTLPVQVEPGLYHTDVSVKLSSESPWKIEVTPEGKNDPIFNFAERPEENDAILDSLPGMYWHFPVTRARAGATVLARHADPRMHNEHGQHVLLATQLVGKGRTFFCAFDSTYRWRYLDDQLFNSFWAHMVDRAGRSKHLGGRFAYSLATDRTEYTPGSQVTLTARFDNPADRAGIEVMHGMVQLGDNPPDELTLNPLPGDANTFQATFTPDKVANYDVRVWSGDPDIHNVDSAAKVVVKVTVPDLESDSPTLNRAALAEIATASGGKVFDLTNPGEIADAFHIRKVDKVLEDRQEVWDAPIIYILVLVSIVLEWVLRKKMQLV
jgi:hypothetical protein